MTLKRQPITIVEIDVDRCTLTYGSSPCTASLTANSVRKCFNTFPTCQDTANYDRGTVTLRFTYNQGGIPKIAGIYPALQSVSTNPITLNLSGIDPKTTALGKRARVTVRLQDFIDDDNFTDPYQAERVSGAAQFDGIGYDTKRGRFLSKLIARSPYYSGRALRIKRGYVGDDVSTMETAHYVISEWSGPNAGGSVEIVAKDVLDLVDSKKAVAPLPSRGKLFLDMAEEDDEFTLVPAGVGDDDYPASGRVRIGREIMTFTRSGDTMTIVKRGVDGSEISDHKEADTVQICLRYEGERACDIIDDLLTVQGPVSSAFVPIADWRSEEDSWLGGTVFTGTISEPTGIATLIGELCQHGVLVWWSEYDQEISFRVNRPLSPGETTFKINDSQNIIAGSQDISRNDDQRVSSLFFWHGILNAAESPTDGKNYSKVVIADDPSSSSANEYDETRIKNIYSRWFGQEGNDPFAAIIAERLVNRYRDTPKVITGSLDVKDADGFVPAALIDLTSYLVQDATGLTATERFQARKVERKEQTIMFEAESYSITGRFAFWMTNPQADYDTATDEEIAEGAFWADEAETDELGLNPYVYF